MNSKQVKILIEHKDIRQYLPVVITSNYDLDFSSIKPTPADFVSSSYIATIQEKEYFISRNLYNVLELLFNQQIERIISVGVILILIQEE